MTTKKWIPVILAILTFVAAFLIIYQQYISFGIWFQIEDLHHETFVLSAIALGIGIFVGSGIAGSNSE